MEKKHWKTIAIILIVFFIVEISLGVWEYVSMSIDNDKLMTCLYEICQEYPDALYENDLCTCYEYDMWGDNLLVAKEEYMR